MGDPRGASFFNLRAYEFYLISILLPETEKPYEFERMSLYLDLMDDDEQGLEEKFDDAVSIIRENYKDIDDATLEMKKSNRGRNYFDYIVTTPSERFGIEIKQSKYKTGSDSVESQIQYEVLFDLLLEKITRPHDNERFKQELRTIKRTLKKYNADGVRWSDITYERSEFARSVAVPARKLLKEMAQYLRYYDTGLMPVLWEYLYGTPIWRVTITPEDTITTYLDVGDIWSKHIPEIVDAPNSLAFSEMNDECSVKLRLHSSSTKVSISSFVAGISFDFTKILRDPNYFTFIFNRTD